MAHRFLTSWVPRLAALALAGTVLAGCNSDLRKDLRPVPKALISKMEQLGMDETAPVLVRIFKEDSALELWKQKRDGTYGLLKTYEICKWSGQLGPKIKEGDYQAPEGFYTVTPAQMNPNSSYYLSFNIGFPNDFDKSLGRTGGNLMVHGACSSAGCYSMTDENAGEIFLLARDAFRGGQRSFQVEAFPFRLTPENMARHHDNANMPFWRMLKVGYDTFEVTRRVPKVDVCNKQYVFNADAGGAPFVAAAACPAYRVPDQIQAAVTAKEAADDAQYKVILAKLTVGDSTGIPVVAASQPGERPLPPPLMNKTPPAPAATPAMAGPAAVSPPPATAAAKTAKPATTAAAQPKASGVGPQANAAAPPSTTGAIAPAAPPPAAPATEKSQNFFSRWF